MTPEAAACGHCKRRLAGEYFFTCRKCGASYCYIHMPRHAPAACATRARVGPFASPTRTERAPLVLAGKPARKPSANV